MIVVARMGVMVVVIVLAMVVVDDTDGNDGGMGFGENNVMAKMRLMVMEVMARILDTAGRGRW